MSRASNGTYTLPAGNPVVTATTISSTWANNTLSDIATALTDSLSRSGLGSMTAPLNLSDGSAGTPGLNWALETTSGLYRVGSGDFRWGIAGSELLQLAGNTFRISGTAPLFRWNETDAAANNKLWDMIVSGEQLALRVLTDALGAANVFTVDRTSGVVDNITFLPTSVFSFPVTTPGVNDPVLISSTLPSLSWRETDAAADTKTWTIFANGGQLRAFAYNDAGTVASEWMTVSRSSGTVSTVNFPTGTLQYGGIEVGYRGLPYRVQALPYTLQASDNGKVLDLSTTASTLTGFAGAAGFTCTITNGNGTNTIAPGSGTLYWFNGSGSLSTGNRTISAGAVVNLLRDGANWYIWGIGIS